MSRRGLGLAVLASGLGMVAGLTRPPIALAQVPAGCYELCGTSCVKPLAIPDRWDDVTAIPGYDGTLKALPNWRYNARYDQETFLDSDANGLWDPGEPFTDGNGNGKHDAEAYDPLLTGFVGDPSMGNAFAPFGDAGRSFTLGYNNGNVSSAVGSYQPIDLPPINKGTPVTGSAAFAENFATCNPSVVEPADQLAIESGAMVSTTNQAMRDLIAQDPGAYWDDISQSVQGSAFALSPRVILVAAFDPRTFPTPGRASVVARKVIPFFMDHMTGTGQVDGRFLLLATTGNPCTSGSAGLWLYTCPSPAERATWGRVKAVYR